MQTSDGRKALPADATNIEADLIHGFFGGDHTRLLKASLPATRYPGYAKSLGLPQRFYPEVHQGLESRMNTKIGGASLWWTPPDVDSTSYFEHTQGDDHLRVLRYQNGTVYFLESTW